MDGCCDLHERPEVYSSGMLVGGRKYQPIESRRGPHFIEPMTPCHTLRRDMKEDVLAFAMSDPASLSWSNRHG